MARILYLDVIHSNVCVICLYLPECIRGQLFINTPLWISSASSLTAFLASPYNYYADNSKKKTLQHEE